MLTLVPPGHNCQCGNRFQVPCLLLLIPSLHTCKMLQHSPLVCNCFCRNKLDGPYDNRIMPIVLSATLIVALSITFGSSIVAYEHDS